MVDYLVINIIGSLMLLIRFVKVDGAVASVKDEAGCLLLQCGLAMAVILGWNDRRTNYKRL